ncbi:hypothetical protein [Paenibacillus graminis]|uniref:Uncharacterized protein n=1 Tax=Paenibacillus graminis TaxID=189425 RepID=A0A089MAW3_9BACL|nr:hypothetical protein [Paenibacillus graminis]AIQ70397.1 hypothetical protein PGRAT_24260 [Paenibacillus graminis]MEC0170291.1 hypothetical protein [Paenibacillus graminis]
MQEFSIPVIALGEQFEMTQLAETQFDAVVTLHDNLSDGSLRVDFVRLNLTPPEIEIIDALDRKRRLEIRIKSLRQYIYVVGDMPGLTEQAAQQLKEATGKLEALIEGIEIKMTTLRDAAIQETSKLSYLQNITPAVLGQSEIHSSCSHYHHAKGV